MAKRSRRATKKTTLTLEREWFERKVAELKAEVENLPADRQEELTRKLREESEQ
jgi:hypothetical protein